MFNRGPMYQPFTSLLGAAPRAGLNWGSLLTNAQKVLGVVNQAIPVFYQVRPIWNNAKTMFKVLGEMGKNNDHNVNSSTETTTTTVKKDTDNQTDNKTSTTNNSVNKSSEPNFFI